MPHLAARCFHHTTAVIPMKLSVPFLQLPVIVDAHRLWAEVHALGEAPWRPHPQGYTGNWGLPLLSAHGDPSDERTHGPMLPTPYLAQCPYLVHVLATLGAVWGRSRLMRLDGNAEVAPHVDINYYWRERVRVHIPILTQPSVRFECGDAHVHMAAGECWIFDTWRLHRVENPADSRRIHLVADTVGSDSFWRLLSGARRHDQRRDNWEPVLIEPASGNIDALKTERMNHPEVMSPWELKDALSFVLGEAVSQPSLAPVQALVGDFFRRWHALWSQFGDDRSARSAYAFAAHQFREALHPNAGKIALRNGVDLVEAISALALAPAVRNVEDAPREHPSARGAPLDSVARSAVTPAPARVLGARNDDSVFKQPVFVVCPPRSGSTLLFETWSAAPDLYTLGRENYEVLEGIAALHPRNRGFDSNRLDATDASDAIVRELRDRYFNELRDRHGDSPTSSPVRMMDKTPKNALRIPFLARAFPEARFVFLHRRPHEVVGSMLEAWESGNFRTYPGLPDWPGPQWSLLLVPGWRDLRGLPLREIVAAQWTRTIEAIVTELEVLPRERWSVVRYDDLVQYPQRTLTQTCREHDLVWDQSLPRELPLSRNTVSAPRILKWRDREHDIAAIWPQMRPTAERLEKFVAQG